MVARYCRVGLTKPEHASLGRLEAELALTPAAMARLRLVVEAAEAPEQTSGSRYRHIQAVEA